MTQTRQTTNGILRIGTSGIVVPGTKQTFPAEFQSGSRLRYYSSLFNTLEVNSTFHKLPLTRTIEKWYNEVPDTFKFTVKLWREITHVKKLAYKPGDIDLFMNTVNPIGDKKSCLLLQFPPSITSEYAEEVHNIIQQIVQFNTEPAWQLAIEFRHSSWYHQTTYNMLDAFNTTLVMHDIEASKTPQEQQTSKVKYLRFHGPSGNYRGSYTNEFIQAHANRIRPWLQHGKDVYVYFNNTMGQALQNAQLLQQLI